MKLNKFLYQNIFKILTTTLLIFFLSGCGWYDKDGWKKNKARKIDPSGDVRARTAIAEGRAFSIGSKEVFGSGRFEFASSNPMWRASLEVLDFLPLANVDYGGGLIITDWYNEGTASGESIKITVRFLTNEVRADGIKILVYKKKCTPGQNCSVKKIKSNLEIEVKTAILKKASIMEKDLRTLNAEAYKKKYGDEIKRIKERTGERAGSN